VLMTPLSNAAPFFFSESVLEQEKQFGAYLPPASLLLGHAIDYVVLDEWDWKGIVDCRELANSY